LKINHSEHRFYDWLYSALKAEFQNILVRNEYIIIDHNDKI